MVKKAYIKAAFEKSVHIHLTRGYVSTCYGKKPLHSMSIEIENVFRDRFCVCLVANVNPNYGVTQLRSYPMSYKSAHRLVCSL